MLYKEIYELVKRAHKGQKYGNSPYTFHLVSVSDKVHELFGADLYTKKIALLHDVLEDTSVTEGDLRKMLIPDQVIEAVVLLTKTDSLGYTEYLRNITKNERAFKVKVADSYCNLTESIKIGDVKRIRKYSSQIEKLYKIRKEIE